jgi:hypothetical protein
LNTEILHGDPILQIYKKWNPEERIRLRGVATADCALTQRHLMLGIIGQRTGWLLLVHLGPFAILLVFGSKLLIWLIDKSWNRSSSWDELNLVKCLSVQIGLNFVSSIKFICLNEVFKRMHGND